MYDRWDLSVLYKGLDDPAYEADFASLRQRQQELKQLLARKSEISQTELIEGILDIREKTDMLAEKLGSFISLSQAVETDNGELMAQYARFSRLLSEGAADNAAAEKLMGACEDTDALIKESEICARNAFSLKEAKRNYRHLLSDEAEEIASALDTNAGSAWGSLQSYLTSTLKVSCKGEEKTLSEVRNLAYSPDAELRKAAYKAEVEAYKKIEDSVAFALNNIKNQVTTMTEKRGYESVLAKTLEDSRMSRATLDAMLQAIGEYLPDFRRYFRHKARLLGHKDGLPWYDLFAPVGSDDRVYSAKEAKDCLVNCFKDLSPDMAGMMERAFDEDWIDFYPRPGKEGGAFCAGLMDQKQARILTNFDGSFGAVDTLAHELGHAYHDMQIQNESALNRGYPMPIAETASTFNELHLAEYALKNSAPSERLALLDGSLRETSQCVVDISCRYMFETKVFEQSRERFLMADDLNEMMLECQKQVYGDGLDPKYLNPGMWICKSHYYSSSFSFYNFPYAFGCLFAQGLYSLFKQRGADFIADYKEMLRLTGVHSIEENALMLGIDLTDVRFWRESLKYIKNRIDEFCEV
ncbi:MAG: M3 family oligoendopeptidase [Clostridia bacterium]|nr:M3 family oligoendopeptidase [Clostridia bacterium]